MEHLENKDAWKDMFSIEEMNILNTVREFEQLRAVMLQEGEEAAGIEATLQRVEREKAISFQLKGVLFERINILLEKESIEAWYEILTWYQWLNAKQLLHRFWEFHMLKIFLDVFIAELKEFYNSQAPISVLLFHSMTELSEVYFKTVFLLRRIEYGIEPVDEIVDYIGKYRLSPIYIQHIVNESKINDKEKVIKTVESWCFA
jgi:hypothetical protein